MSLISLLIQLLPHVLPPVGGLELAHLLLDVGLPLGGAVPVLGSPGQPLLPCAGPHGPVQLIASPEELTEETGLLVTPLQVPDNDVTLLGVQMFVQWHMHLGGFDKLGVLEQVNAMVFSFTSSSSYKFRNSANVYKMKPSS